MNDEYWQKQDELANKIAIQVATTFAKIRHTDKFQVTVLRSGGKSNGMIQRGKIVQIYMCIPVEHEQFLDTLVSLVKRVPDFVEGTALTRKDMIHSLTDGRLVGHGYKDITEQIPALDRRYVKYTCKVMRTVCATDITTGNEVTVNGDMSEDELVEIARIKLGRMNED